VEFLLNWLLQGILVAVAAAAGLRALAGASAGARYGFIWIAYLVVLVLPALPALSLLSIGRFEAPAAEIAASPAGPIFTMPAAWWTTSATAIALCSVWSIALSLQLAAGVAALRRARRGASRCPDPVLMRLPHWPHVSGTGRPARVVVSSEIRFAAVLGCGTPIIAIAPQLLDQLSGADLDRVLVHEWAHVQRRDDVAQLAQRLVRAVAGWHPAIWWLERQLDYEREVACDEIAVALTGSSKGYAASLTTLAALPRPSVRALPALAAVSPTGLRRRLVRILALPPGGATRRPQRATAACAAAALAAVGFAVNDLRAVVSAPAPIALPSAPSPPDAGMTAVDRHPSAEAVSAGRPAAAAAAVASRRDRPGRTAVSTGRDGDAPLIAIEARRIEAPPPTMPFAPLASTEWAAGAAVHPIAEPATPRAGLEPASSTAREPRQAGEGAVTPWAAANDAGVALGRSSQNAGVATAGFFTRFGKRIARSF
jgi:bla regulator protein blaR1